MVQLKRGLLRTTALCLGLAAPLIVTSQSAEASCTSYSPTSGTTVTCSGMSTSGVSAKSGAANVIVNLGAGAQLTAASGIGVQSSSTINISGSVVATNGIAAIVAGDNSAINLSGTAVLIGRDVAVLLFGNDNMVSVADLSQIEAGLYAIQVAGNENTINFSGSATAQSDGNVLLVEGDGNKIFLNDTVLISGRGGPLIVGTGNLVTAIGGDGEVAEGLRLGGFIGTTMGEEEVASKGGGSTSQGLLGMVYGTVRKAGAFLSAAMGGGYQTYELSRKASVAGTLMS
jgi:hypothetical protein